MASPARVFLGWDRPVLESAAAWLLAQHPDLDLSHLVILLPSSRAGRLLKALLAERVARGLAAGAAGGALSPPTTITPGELGAALARPSGVPAGPAARRLAWIEAMRRAGNDVLRSILRAPPDLTDAPALSRLASLFESWSSQVASTGRRLGEVAEVGAAITDFADEARWNAAAEIQRHYEQVLREHGAHDDALALIDSVDALALTRAARSREGDAGGDSAVSARDIVPPDQPHYILVGVLELAPILRAAIEHAGVRVTSLLAAPQEESDAFDALGCIDVERWSDRRLDLDDTRLHFRDRPQDQADLVLDVLASLGGRYAAEQIVVGVPDAEVEPLLEAAGRRTGAPGAPGLEFRASEGKALELTPPAVFVRAARDYLGTRSLSAFASLVRHPDVEHSLLRDQVDGRIDATSPDGTRGRNRPVEHWLGLLDHVAGQTLADTATAPWRGGTPAQRAALDSLRNRLHALLGPLLEDDRRPAAHWGRELVACLARLYAGRKLSPQNPVHAQTIATCDRLRQDALDLFLAPPLALSAADALSVLLDAASDASLPAAPARDAIEMLGWLELPLDPAPVAIVTGFNEGMVPSRPSQEPMLPEQLRAALGLSTSRTRLARDACLLTLMVRSRQRVEIVVGRRAGEGDPLLPSRLLFACDDQTAARRLGQFATERHDAPSLAPTDSRAEHPEPSAIVGAGYHGVDADAEPPRWGGCPTLDDEALPDSLAVTAFGLYLRSPYEFYVRHVHRAREVEEPEVELPPTGFGTLLHATLADLATTDAATSDDPARVAQALTDLLATRAGSMYGPSPRTAVVAQIDAARARLVVFARHQAGRAADGWRILHTEWESERGRAHLLVDGVATGIHGKIDRIDRHEDGRLAIIDYKTGETPHEPEKAHRAGRRDARVWIDLQLPLYRHLAARLVRPSPTTEESHSPARASLPPFALAYALLGADDASIKFAEASWSAEDLESADEAAREVVRAIRRREFGEAGRYSDQRVLEALCAAPGGRARPRRRPTPRPATIGVPPGKGGAP